MTRALPHIFARTFNTPLLIHATRLDALVAGLRMAAGERGGAGGSATEAELRRLFKTNGDEEGSSEWQLRPIGYRISPAGVAVIGVRDVLVKRDGEITADSTVLESYAHIGTVVRAALGDGAVNGILLDIDSCGGEVGGLFDLCDDIRTLSSVKPIWAAANDDCLSAAYCIASATQRIFATRTAALGSIGVVALHCDQSGFDADEGLKYEYVFAGAHKIDGNPHEPLAADARSQLQAEVDRLHVIFAEHVAAGRGLSLDTVMATEAAVFYGEKAVAMGLADDLGNANDALAAMAAAIGRPEGLDMTLDDLPAPPAAARDATVVQLDAVRTAGANIRRDAREIMDLCALAAKRIDPARPELAMQLARMFVERGTPLEAARRELERRQAIADQALQIETIDTSQIGRRDAPTGGLADSEFVKISNERWAAQMGRTRAKE
jgi:signal peptide peptidase SppA